MLIRQQMLVKTVFFFVWYEQQWSKKKAGSSFFTPTLTKNIRGRQNCWACTITVNLIVLRGYAFLALNEPCSLNTVFFALYIYIQNRVCRIFLDRAMSNIYFSLFLCSFPCLAYDHIRHYIFLLFFLYYCVVELISRKKTKDWHNYNYIASPTSLDQDCSFSENSYSNNDY